MSLKKYIEWLSVDQKEMLVDPKRITEKQKKMLSIGLYAQNHKILERKPFSTAEIGFFSV